MRATSTKPVDQSLLNLTAADLMTTPVLTIPQATSLREAARLLVGAQVSGAPVVDEQGKCVGVLSSSDFVTLTRQGGEQEQTTTFIAPWGESINIEVASDTELRQYMTADPVTVPPEMPIGAVAQKMIDAHIHRVLVVTDQDQTCGIISSTDILAAVARAAAGGRPNPRARARPARRRR